jgi:hypothetical protein
MNKEYAGLGGFVWWVGVVEDRNDPLKLGRCRVRIFGWHSESIVDCPTKTLPWAQAMMPLNNANTYTPKESDMVVGFFTDGENAQVPVMMGILPGIPLATPNPQQGFNDTRDGKQLFVSPVKPEDGKTNYPRKLDEPTTSQLARYDNLPYQISNLKENALRFERQPSYNAKYPYNNAMESESGHAIEIDDTPQYERIHIYHRMGSNQEYRPDGSVQQKIVKDSTRSIGGDDLTYIKGNSLFVIDGDLTYIVKGQINFLSEKDIGAAAEGSISLNAKDSFSAAATVSASVCGTVSSSLGGASLLTDVSGGKTDVSGVGSVSVSALGYAEFGASGATTINGATINFLAASADVPDGGDGSSSSQDFGTDTTKYDSFNIDAAGKSPFNLDGVTPSGLAPTTSAKITSAQSDAAGIFSNFNYASISGTSQELATSPSLLNTTTLADSVQKSASSLVDKVTNKIKNLPDDIVKKVGVNDLTKSYDNLGKKAFIASKLPSVDSAFDLAKASTDFLATTAQVTKKVLDLNVAGESFKEYLGDVCTVKDIRNAAKRITNRLIERKNEIVDKFKEARDANRELIKNATQKFKDDLKEMDRKSLQEWIDSHAYDSSCAVCANEASTNLSNEMPEDQVRKLLTQCVFREAEAFINKNKSTIPITGSKIIEQETDVCGKTEIKVNIGD